MATGSAQRAPAAAWVSRQAWTLERFGLSPGKLPKRLSDQGAPRVFCVSIPKSGTHLLERALCLHPALYRKLVPTISGANIGEVRRAALARRENPPGQVVVSHLRHSEPDERTLDERGRARALHGAEPTGPGRVADPLRHQANRPPAARPVLVAARRARAAAQGDRRRRGGGAALDRRAARVLRGLAVERPARGPVRGPGGQRRRRRRRPPARPAAGGLQHLGVDASAARVGAVAGRLFSADSPTFRAGQVGSSRDFFDDELEELFRRTIGDSRRALRVRRLMPEDDELLTRRQAAERAGVTSGTIRLWERAGQAARHPDRRPPARARCTPPRRSAGDAPDGAAARRVRDRGRGPQRDRRDPSTTFGEDLGGGQHGRAVAMEDGRARGRGRRAGGGRWRARGRAARGGEAAPAAGGPDPGAPAEGLGLGAAGNGRRRRSSGPLPSG